MLKDHVINPASGDPPEYVVIFFHGYSSTGEKIAEAIRESLPEKMAGVKFRCPDAPIVIDPEYNRGRSWFDVEDMLNSPDSNKAAQRARAALADVQEYIDRVV